MPIYEYQRPDGTTFEVLQSFDDEPLTRDPQSGVPVRRVLHAPAVHFKGSGFYNTDYGTRKRQREQNGKAESASGEAAGAEKSSGEKGSGGDRAGAGKDTAGGEGTGASKPQSPTKSPQAAAAA